ncbi:hypothetical protein [Candidatus Methylomicrobium oryzae]|uniref:hypothetical protein n=1 Tax=Candidatus Methylomicrobium oryzae TaxID=2802053 RepID=UPI0019203F72|nr:hypothetical protein [Methylomicrobium sp. RS1]MBL1263902.1 hypothetical protein [Methylomicrobium sp. RS1]
MIEMAWHESAQRVSNIQAKAIPSFRFNLAILLSGEKKLANRLWHRSLTIERIPPQTIAYRLISIKTMSSATSVLRHIARHGFEAVAENFRAFAPGISLHALPAPKNAGKPHAEPLFPFPARRPPSPGRAAFCCREMAGPAGY